VKVAIIGSRDFNDLEYMIETLKPYENKITKVISGGAKGADTIAEQWAKHRTIPFQEYTAKWNDVEGKPKYQIGENSYGKYWKWAGHSRNTTMAEECDCCVAFWDGKSTGTAHMIKECKRLNKPLKIIYI